MRVARGGQAQCLLQCDLPRRAVEEIGAAHNVRDALQRIIDDNGELVGKGAIATADDDIAALAQAEFTPSLQTILDRDERVIDAKAHRRRTAAPRARAASTGVTALAIVLAARAAALEGRPERPQRLEGLSVMRGARALVLDRAVPVECESLQRPQDGRSGAFHLARAIDILHTHEPLAAAAARVQVTAECSDERAEMQ